jgi:hypothetical protein
MRPFLSLVLTFFFSLACGSSGGGGNNNAPKPLIQAFSARPATLPPAGGTSTLSWNVTDATSLTVDDGVGALSPTTSGTKVVPVSSTTTFTLNASGTGGSASMAATVTVCDAAGVGGTCTIPAAGQCVDFGGLSSQDLASVQAVCRGFNGTFGNTACSSTNRVGHCQIPPLGPNTGVTCSPQGTILESYYPPTYDQTSAQGACALVAGTVFTPG